MAQSATATKTATSNGKAATPSSDDIAAQLETLKKDIASLTRSVADLGVAKKDQMAEAAADQAAKMRAKGRESYEHAQDSAREYADAASKKIQENPAAAVGIAAGAGFLLGMIFARK